MSHTPKTPTPSYTTATLPTDLPEGSVVFDSTQQKLVSFKDGTWNTIGGGGGVGSTTYVRDNVAGVIDQIQGNIPQRWKEVDTSLKGLVIGTSCERINGHAFGSCTGLTGTLVIPTSVKFLGIGAFNSCTGLTGTVVLHQGIEEVQNGVFGGCTGITRIDCYITRTILEEAPSVLGGSGVTTIHVRATDDTWTAGASQTIGGKTGITVIKDL